MIETPFTPFPVLSTDRLLLRQIETEDAKNIFVHRNDDKVNTFLTDFRHESIEETQAFIERIKKEVAANKTILWVITEKGKNKFLGTVCLWNISKNEAQAETGYTLDPAFHKMGYMNEALKQIIDFGFKRMELKTIVAYTHQSNQGSINLLIKNNFKPATSPKTEIESNRIFFTLTNKK